MSADKIKKEEKKVAEEKKFVQFAPETVSVIADSAGATAINTNIARALSEDVSYRCRELSSVSVHLEK